jgi:hypothetical protein
MKGAGSGGEAAAAYVRGYLKPAAGFMASRTAKYMRGVPSVESYTGRPPGAFGAGATPGRFMNDDPRIRGVLRNSVAPTAQKVSHDLGVRIDLNGFPKGTRTRTSTDGVFREVSLNRGRAGVYANEDA